MSFPPTAKINDVGEGSSLVYENLYQKADAFEICLDAKSGHFYLAIHTLMGDVYEYTNILIDHDVFIAALQEQYAKPVS